MRGVQFAASTRTHGNPQSLKPLVLQQNLCTCSRPRAPAQARPSAHAVCRRPRRHASPPAAPSVQTLDDSLQLHRQPHRRKRESLSRCVCQQQQDAAAAEADAVTAGIPLSGEVLTAPGQRLTELLLEGVASDFVQHVKQTLQELAEPGIGISPDPAMHRIAFARIQAVCEDIIYAWALAETYVADANMQRDMRAMLGRDQDGMLSDGAERKLLRTTVQFLSGREGQYQLGSVTFRADAEASTGSASATDRHPELEQPPDTDVRPALDPVLASARGQYLLATEGSTPTRMDRDGAAKTYATYTSWGYFSRRMWVRRQLKLDERLEQADVLPDPHQPMVADTSYGKTSAAWRFFEAVPSQLSEFRTPEAAAVADRHLRALFGNVGGECITTLAAWTVMCEEARSFGRSLYDAEQVVLDNLMAGTSAAGE